MGDRPSRRRQVQAALRIDPQRQDRRSRQEAALVFGVPLDVEPHEALLYCVRSAAGRCAALRARIDLIKESEAFHEVYTQQVLNPWLREYKLAEEALAKYSKMALDAGVNERAVTLAEHQAEDLVRLFRGIFAEVSISDEDMERLPEVIQRHLSTLEKPRVPEVIVAAGT